MVRRYLSLYLFLQGAQSSSFPADPSAARSWSSVKTKRFQRSVFKMWLCRRCSRTARCNDSQWVNTAFFFLCEVGSLDPWIHCCCRGSFLICEWQPWWELFGVSTGLNAASCLISFSTGYTVPPFIKRKGVAAISEVNIMTDHFRNIHRHIFMQPIARAAGFSLQVFKAH